MNGMVVDTSAGYRAYTHLYYDSSQFLSPPKHPDVTTRNDPAGVWSFSAGNIQQTRIAESLQGVEPELWQIIAGPDLAYQLVPPLNQVQWYATVAVGDYTVYVLKADGLVPDTSPAGVSNATWGVIAQFGEAETGNTGNHNPSFAKTGTGELYTEDDNAFVHFATGRHLSEPGTPSATLQVAQGRFTLSAGCAPPPAGDWHVTSSCTFVGSATAPGDVVVEDSAVLTIASGAALDVDFSQHELLVESGSRLVVEAGGLLD